MVFSISTGSDGTPEIKPVKQKADNFEKPLTDKIEHQDHYEIIMDVPGITNEDQIKLIVNIDNIEFIAENDEFHYKQKIEFDKTINKKIKAQLKNRTIVLKVFKKN